MDALSHDEVRRLCGDISDTRIADIIATGATLQEIEVAVAWAAGESDVMGERRHPLSGAARQVYDILMAGEEWAGDEEPERG